MTVKTESEADSRPEPVLAQSLSAEFAGSAATPAAGTAPGSFAGFREMPEPVRSEAVPHFLGALLIALSAGFISCVVALLYGRSLLEALAIYTLVGGALFVGLLIVRSAPDDPDP